MRLDKFISNNSEYTRSMARKLAKAGRISVNGELVDDPSIKIKKKKDEITIDGKIIKPVGQIYYMLNKPEGYVCTNEEGHHPIVLDLIIKSNYGGDHASYVPAPIKDLQIVGRLDIDTTGLLLLTNDGEWNHQVTSPNSDCKKTYRVLLQDPFDMKFLNLFTQGMPLEGEKKPTRPAMVEIITPDKLRLTISEGKYHQVKRMFAATGNKVKKLHRESVGEIALDKSLKPGQYRLLTEAEVKSVGKKSSLAELNL